MLDCAVVDVTDAPRDIDLAALEREIDNHNMAVTGRRDYRSVGVFERDPRTATGEVIAGLYGLTWGDWLEIKLIWVRPDHCGRGLARRLVEVGETEVTPVAELPDVGQQAETDTFGVLLVAGEITREKGVLPPRPTDHATANAMAGSIESQEPRASALGTRSAAPAA